MKKTLIGVAAAALVLAASVVPSLAGGGWHGGGHGWHGGGWYGGWRGPVFFGPRVVVGVGSPFWYPGPYAYPYLAPYPVYSPPVVVAAPAPPVYTQQAPQYWYYCQSPAGYYPNVPQCPGGWMQVAPQAQQ